MKIWGTLVGNVFVNAHKDETSWVGNSEKEKKKGGKLIHASCCKNVLCYLQTQSDWWHINLWPIKYTVHHWYGEFAKDILRKNEYPALMYKWAEFISQVTRFTFSRSNLLIRMFKYVLINEYFLENKLFWAQDSSNDNMQDI